MKKIKLLSSLSVLAVVGSVTPIVATACSDNKLQIIVDSLLTNNAIVTGDYGYIMIKCVAYDNHTTLFKSVEASCNVEGVTCSEHTIFSSYSLGLIQVQVQPEVKVGTNCTVTIKVEDENGHHAEQDVKFKVVESDYHVDLYTGTRGEASYQSTHGLIPIIKPKAGEQPQTTEYTIAMANGHKTTPVDNSKIMAAGVGPVIPFGTEGDKEISFDDIDPPAAPGDPQTLKINCYSDTLTGIYICDADGIVDGKDIDSYFAVFVVDPIEP